MELSQQLQQSLKLKMTNELRQAIHLLQFSATELVEFIQEQAEENPLIEIAEQAIPSYKKNRTKDVQSSENPIEHVATRSENYIEQLLREVQWMQVSEDERKVLRYLIYSLDERGYLDLDGAEALKALNCTAKGLEEGINRLQSMQPAGIGARNLTECLTLQLLQMDHIQLKVPLKLVQHLELVATSNWQQLEKICEADQQEIKDGVALIKTLNPKPLGAFSVNETAYLFPDIIIKKTKSSYEVIIDGNLPKFSYNKDYMALAKFDEQTHKYVQEKYKQYNWLQKGLEQRRKTLQSFVDVFLKKQIGLIRFGKTHLKPMTMKEIADVMGVHESTVSRVVKNKYMQTPLGMYSVRDLFTSTIGTSTGDGTSSASVKQKIQELVLNENKSSPLSDQKIAEQLNHQFGIKISRRTVTKYREQLQILSSTLRKER